MLDTNAIQTAFKEQIIAIQEIDDALYDLIQEVRSKNYISIKEIDKKIITVSVTGEGKNYKFELGYNELFESILNFDAIYTDQAGLEIKEKIIYLIKDKLIKSVNSNALQFL